MDEFGNRNGIELMCRGYTEEEEFRNKGKIEKVIVGNTQMENGWKSNEENVAWSFKTPGREGVKACHQHDWSHSLICNAN